MYVPFRFGAKINHSRGAANRVALVKLDVRQKFRKNISEALLFAWSRFWSHTMNNLVSPSPAWSKL